MTEPTDPVLTPAPEAPVNRPERLYRVAAWVAIAAGGLVILVVVFGSGFFLGKEIGTAGDRGPGQHRMSEIIQMRPGQPPFGRMERQPGPDQQFPNVPGLPQPPEGTSAPQRPSATPTP